jgi:hypothetical protein
MVFGASRRCEVEPITYSSTLRSATHFLLSIVILLSQSQSAAIAANVSSRSAAIKLEGYASIPALVIQAKAYGWSGNSAVSKRTFEIRFVRDQGWYVIQNNEDAETHTWSDSDGCHTFQFSVRAEPRGYYQQVDFPCDQGPIAERIGWTFEESPLSWLQGVPSSYVDLQTCDISQTELNCKKAGFRLAASLTSGRITRALVREDTLSLTVSIEITERSVGLSKEDLRPNPEQLNIFTVDASQSPDDVYTRAANGDVLSARQALLLMASNQIPEPPNMQTIFRALETAYHAKLPLADYYSAQFYSLKAAAYRPPDLAAWGTKRLRAEFRKRMIEAATACNIDVLQRMEEGCLELNCEGDNPQEDIARLSFVHKSTCEAPYFDRFQDLERPEWTKRAFEP